MPSEVPDFVIDSTNALPEFLSPDDVRLSVSEFVVINTPSDDRTRSGVDPRYPEGSLHHTSVFARVPVDQAAVIYEHATEIFRAGKTVGVEILAPHDQHAIIPVTAVSLAGDTSALHVIFAWPDSIPLTS